jgi:hypothetical protein
MDKTPSMPDIFISLPMDKLGKIKPITEENVRKALEEGKRDRDAAESLLHQGTMISHNLFYC